MQVGQNYRIWRDAGPRPQDNRKSESQVGPRTFQDYTCNQGTEYEDDGLTATYSELQPK